MSDELYLTTKKIAARLRLTDREIRRLAKQLGIGSQLPDNTWVFREDDVEKFEKRNKVGRPSYRK